MLIHTGRVVTPHTRLMNPNQHNKLEAALTRTKNKHLKVNIISAPYNRVAFLCKDIAASNRFCFNPEVDFPMYGVTADQNARGWMYCWERVCVLVKETGGTCFLMQHYRLGLQGGQQDGERFFANTQQVEIQTIYYNDDGEECDVAGQPCTRCFMTPEQFADAWALSGCSRVGRGAVPGAIIGAGGAAAAGRFGGMFIAEKALSAATVEWLGGRMLASAVVGGVAGLIVGVLISGAVHYFFFRPSDSNDGRPKITIAGNGSNIDFEQTMQQTSPEAKRAIKARLERNLQLLDSL